MLAAADGGAEGEVALRGVGLFAITLVMFGTSPRDFCTWVSSSAAAPVAVAGSIW